MHDGPGDAEGEWNMWKLEWDRIREVGYFGLFFVLAFCAGTLLVLVLEKGFVRVLEEGLELLAQLYP